MIIRSILPLLALVGLVFGQTTTTGGSVGTTTSTAAIQTWTVSVGKGDNSFVVCLPYFQTTLISTYSPSLKPQVLQTNVGDIVEFQFYPSNHSVVRAEYLYPCVPYEDINKGKPGFFSGFKPVDAILSNPPSWQLKINDSLPIFYYCSAVGSCIEYGMVGVINPNASVSIETQVTAAKSAKYMLQPGENFPSEGSSSSSSSPSSTSSASSSSASSTTTPAIIGSKSSSFPKGAIAGIVVGAVALLGLAAGMCFFFGRAKSLREEINRQSLHPSVASIRSPGHLSPAPPAMADPMYQNGGTVYIPVKASDLTRVSLPPYGAHSVLVGADAPISPQQNRSPSQPQVPVYNQEAGAYTPHPSSSPGHPHQRFV